MVFSIFRHLQRTRIVAESVGCCRRRVIRAAPRVRCLSTLHGGSVCSQAFQAAEEETLDKQLMLDDEMLPEKVVDPKNRLEEADYFNVSELVDLRELFNARVHLGHKRECMEPSAHRYIYGQRAGHTIIDLNQTVPLLKEALNVLSHVVYNHGVVLFASTDPRHDFVIQKTARLSGEYFITRQWYQGQFTNARHFYKTDKILPDIVIAMNLTRFQKVKELVEEASRCNIPVIGLVDTDCDARMVTYPVPANDDTTESVAKLCDIFEKAITRAKARRIDDDALVDKFGS